MTYRTDCSIVGYEKPKRKEKGEMTKWEDSDDSDESSEDENGPDEDFVE